MLIPVFAVRLLLVDPLARVLEQTNMFPRAVTHATDSICLFSQHSTNEYPKAAL
jgi:hypothetical protein